MGSTKQILSKPKGEKKRGRQYKKAAVREEEEEERKKESKQASKQSCPFVLTTITNFN
jgi:hypothetical protein